MSDLLYSGPVGPGHVVGGRYRVLKLLGQGGGGYVYKVHDAQSGRELALKWLNRGGEVNLRRFRREFLSTSRLSHPNIVAVYEVSEDESDHYYTMEFVDGLVLNEWVGQGPDLNAPERLERIHRALPQVLSALSYIHRRHIVHRDFKPQNVMVDKAGVAKIMDFGLARERSHSWVSLTGGRIVGTLNYISPEQLDSREVDARTDLYSLGVTLYELLTGQFPFDSDSPAVVMAMILHEAPRAPRELNPVVDPFLELVALTLLRKDPAQRFQSADELMDVLGRRELPKPAAAGDDAQVAEPERLETGGGLLYRPGLMGREQELKTLRDAMARACNGSAALVLVEGDSGMGKTRMVEELKVMARGVGAQFFVAAGREDSKTPYAPLKPVFEKLATKLLAAPSRVNWQLVGQNAPALVELSDRFERIEALGGFSALAPAPPDEQFFRVAAAAAGLLRALSQSSPIVFVGEDLHTWDQTSLKAFRQVAGVLKEGVRDGGPEARALFVGTYLDEEGEGDGKIWRVLSMLKKRCPVVTLKALSRAQVEAMVASMMGDVKRLEGLADWLFAETEGNPYFIAETVKMLAEEGYLARVRGAWRFNWEKLGRPPRATASREDFAQIPVPNGARELIARRVAKLVEAEKRLLEAASVIGRDFEFDLLKAALEVEEDELLEAVDKLLKARILVDRRGFDDVLSFDQEKLRGVLLADIPAHDRRVLHERVARALEWRGVSRLDDLVVRLAHHFTEAGIADKAMPYLPRAGERLEAAHLTEEAVKLYESFLALLSRLEGNDRERWRETSVGVKERLARLFRLAGRHEESLALHDDLLAEAKDLGRRDLAARVLIEVARVQEHKGQYEVAGHLAKRALGVARTEGFREIEASALQELSALMSNRGRAAEAVEYFREAADILGELQDPCGRAEALTNMGNQCFNLGQFDQALEQHEEALALKRGLGDKAGVAISLNNIGNIYFMRGNFEAALRCHADSLAIRRETSHRKGIAYSHANIAAILVELGDFAEAREHLEQSLEMSHELEDRKLAVINLINLAHASIAEGDFARARAHLEEAAQTSRQIGIRLFESGIAVALAAVAEGFGECEEAVERARQGLELAREMQDSRGQVVAALKLAELTEGEIALGYAERALELGRTVSNDVLTLRALHRLGLLELRLGRESAAEHLQAAKRLLEKLAGQAGQRRQIFLTASSVRGIVTDLRSLLETEVYVPTSV